MSLFTDSLLMIDIMSYYKNANAVTISSDVDHCSALEKMFANLKKKLEEGSAVSPVGADRKPVIASSAAKAQNTCYVHGEGSVFVSVFMH